MKRSLMRALGIAGIVVGSATFLGLRSGDGGPLENLSRNVETTRAAGIETIETTGYWIRRMSEPEPDRFAGFEQLERAPLSEKVSTSLERLATGRTLVEDLEDGCQLAHGIKRDLEGNARDAIARTAREYGFSAGDVLAYVAAESAGDLRRDSSIGARAPMHVMPETYRDLAIEARRGTERLAGLVSDGALDQETLEAMREAPMRDRIAYGVEIAQRYESPAWVEDRDADLRQASIVIALMHGSRMPGDTFPNVSIDHLKSIPEGEWSRRLCDPELNVVAGLTHLIRLEFQARRQASRMNLAPSFEDVAAAYNAGDAALYRTSRRPDVAAYAAEVSQAAASLTPRHIYTVAER